MDLAIKNWKQYLVGVGGYPVVFVDALNKNHIPPWFRLILSEQIIPYWQTYAFILIGIQVIVAISYIIGYVVRPVSILAVLLCIMHLMVFSAEQEIFFKLLIACHVVLAWVGAGRCLGVDYYFFKTRRGVWW